MPTIETLLQSIRAGLAPEIEHRLRAALADKDRDWLIEQLVRLSLGPELAFVRDKAHADQLLEEDRTARIDRLRTLGLDPGSLSSPWA